MSSSVITERSQKQTYRVKLLTFAAVVFAVVWAVGLPLFFPYTTIDLDIYLRAARGETLDGFFYAPWVMPYLYLLTALPYKLAWIVVNLVNLAGLFTAAKVFGGSLLMLAVSYPLLFVLFYGQIDGLYALGFVVMYIGLRRDKPALAAAGWMLALIKYYIGGPLGLGLVVCFALNRKQAVQVFSITALFILLSFAVWGLWPLETFRRVAVEIPGGYTLGMDTWELFGPVILILWAPLLALRSRSYIWWAATCFLTIPHLYPHSLVHLIVLPIGPVGWLFNLPYVVGFGKATYLHIVPFMIYLMLLSQHIAERYGVQRQWFYRFRGDPKLTQAERR